MNAYMLIIIYLKRLKQSLKIEDQLLCNAGQKYCRMLPLEHSAILSTFIKLPFVIKFILSFFWVAAKDMFYHIDNLCVLSVLLS